VKWIDDGKLGSSPPKACKRDKSNKPDKTKTNAENGST
jgi:hypothetical protein